METKYTLVTLMLKLNILYLTQKIINKLKNDIIYTFDTGARPYIEQIMLFDEEDNLILRLKR